ncbi:hypothetical protein LMH87_009910 [Akanthomyces muscarius]|uniref:Uncharacterized protein n=1 Tax=Akanthomyces muscarius TaxID=2231603 RepID=A0A9W8QFN3_AKAMU|nr:hypothetical protein LMH87_009910 [Akanthomyces muscarius]KAJ4153424.1 hypothetical protein LMH87_009910 [Akanthomyces muscarius]
MVLRYSAEFLLHLRNSPLCTKPDGLPPIEEWMGAPAEQQTRTQNPEEIVFAPPRINFSSSRTKLLDGDKAAKELEQGRFGIRSSENDRTRDSRANPLRRRGDSDFDGEGWSTVKPRKSFGADGAERFSGKMGGNYRDEVRSSDRDGNRDRQSKTADAFGRDKDRDADGRTRNGLTRKMEPWNKSEATADGAAPERRDRDRTRSWRDRDQEASADNRGGDRRWGRDRDQRAEREPEWFDEPAQDQRDVHTQQDFQKWMEQMKAAKNAQENQTTEESEAEKPAKSAPAIEQGPDKFFMAFGGGTAIDNTPQAEQADGASKPRAAGKSSRFTSFFGGGGQEEPRQRTESSTPATAAPSVPPGFAHLFGGMAGGMAGAGGRGGSTGPEDEKQAFAQLLAKLQKQTVSATPPGLSLFAPPQQNPGDGSKKSAVTSPEPYQQYGNERREGPSVRPQQQEIHAPRPQQQTAGPDQLLQDLVGQHQRASSQSSSQRDPTMAKNNSNAEFLMNLMRAGPPNTQRAEQLHNMMAHGGPLQQKPSSMSPMNERDAHAHQQQGRPGPPPGFPAHDDAFRSPDPESRPNPTQILQRPPPPPGLDHMPPNWMHGPLPPGVGPPPGQRGAGGPMMAPPGLPGGHPSRNMPMPHMFPPNFPPGAMPPPPPPEMRGSMHMPPPGFFNGPPPPHGFGLPPGMPGFNGPPPPDLRAFGSPPFDGRGMAPPSSAEAGRNGGNYGRQ